MAETNPLHSFVKGFLGYYGSGYDAVLTPVILAAQQSLAAAGVNEPEEDAELYNTAVALQCRILLDGDEKGYWQRALTSIVLQMKEYTDAETT